MITKALFKKAVVLSVATLLLGVLFSAISTYAADKPIVLGKYPTLKSRFYHSEPGQMAPQLRRQPEEDHRFCQAKRILIL